MIRKDAFGAVSRYSLARTLAGRAVYWTAAYYVDGLLVDTGCRYAASELAEALSGKALQRIVNTHSHEDHIGANGFLQRQSKGLEILAHRSGVPVLANPRGKQPLHPYRRLFWGYPEPSQGSPISDGTTISTERYRLQVISTPGHSPCHVCLYEADQGWLFSGDLFVGGKDRALRADTDIWPVVDSLKKISKLPVEWLFPGSARARRNPAAEIQSKIDYFESLGEQVQDLHSRGRSVGEIARTLFGKPGWVEIITLGHFSRKHLVQSFLRARSAC